MPAHRSRKKIEHSKTRFIPAHPEDAQGRPFSWRLQRAIAAWKIADLAEVLGTARQTIYGWLAGRSEPDLKMIRELALQADVRDEWLAFGTPPRKRRGEGTGLGDYVKVPLLLPGQDDWRREDPPICFDRLWLSNVTRHQGAMLVRMLDDTMEPTIPRDALLLIGGAFSVSASRDSDLRERSSPNLANVSPPTGIFALRAGGFGYLIRRVHARPDGSLIISSDNPRYGPERYESKPGRVFSTLGEVVWIGKEV